MSLSDKENPTAGNRGVSEDELGTRSTCHSTGFEPTAALLSMPSDHFLVWCEGQAYGRVEGILAGWQMADAAAARLHHAAWRTVQGVAAIPSHDELEQRRKPRRPEWLDPSAPWPFIPEQPSDERRPA
jgi:hypothetical protein